MLHALFDFCVIYCSYDSAARGAESETVMKKPCRTLLLVLSLCLLPGCLGCGSRDTAPAPSPSPALTAAEPTAAEPSTPAPTVQPLLSEAIPDDNCRNWYEIFVYSFEDSNGDGIGDLAGVTRRLPYIRDLGFTGIWLMPIMPSPSYHKYDVTDYCAIDPAYGTLEDFSALLAAAHALGIRVIVDLPVNHTSSAHPWFTAALADPDSPYRAYYNFADAYQSGYASQNGLYYEARFVSSMPDLNLDSEAVRAEICDILRFWLTLGVDGFRLDAVTSYDTASQKNSIAFCTFLNEQAKAIRPDCFLVGEAWSDLSVIAAYYASGVDSFFCFPLATATGSLAKILTDAKPNRGQRYQNLTAMLEEYYGTDALMAPFVGNHDTDRITSAVGVRDLPRLKALWGMLALMRGGVFVYYGDEIGMIGTGDDPNKRIGMLFSTEEHTTVCPPGTTGVKYLLPGAEAQLADAASLLQYVRHAMNLRNAIPAIARGVSTVLPGSDPAVAVIRRISGETAVTLVLNLSADHKSLAFDPNEAGCHTLLGALDASGTGAIVYRDGLLTLGPWDMAVLG